MSKEHYSYKGKDYYIQEKVELKNPETRKWQTAYIYVQVGSGLKFCREIRDFKRLFIFEGFIKE